MSRSKSLKRQIARNSNQFLGQYSGQLKPDWQNRPQTDKNIVAMMARNGITPQDLEKAWKDGRTSAFEQTAPLVMKQCYAAFSTVLVDEFGFSPEDAFKAIHMADQKIVTAIDLEEALDEMREKARIEFRSEEGVERVVQL